MQQIGWARQPAVVEDILTWVITDALWNKEVQTMKDFRFDADADADVGNSLFVVTPAGLKQINGNTGAINSVSAADADAIPGPEDTPEGKMGNRRDALLRAIFG
jgi:hypothetical protein